jgi:glycosyltransferase involved in cell wall biosynthesis
MNVLALVPYLHDTAPGQRFRIEQWARLLGRQDVAFTFASFETEALHAVVYRRGRLARKATEVARGLIGRLRLLPRISGFDVVFLYREAAPLGPPVIERLLARRRVPIVYDFDDAIYLPETSTANRAVAPFKCAGKVAAICGLSRWVTVGNGHLARFAESRARHVRVLPTTIDVERLQPRGPRGEDGPLVIGWMGSETTLPHLALAAEPLRELAARRRFVLHVVSPREVSLPGVEVRSTRWDAVREADDLRSFDVGIMPLPDDPWTRGKCAAKLLLYMGAGVPGVASPVGVTAEIVDDGVNGFLAPTAADWVRKLEALIDSPALRASMGAAARRTVEARFSGQAVAPLLLDVLRRCARD